MATYMQSDVSSYSGSSDSDSEGTSGSSLYGEDMPCVKQVVLPLECFYKKVLSDLLISPNDSFFNYCFEQIFSRKLAAKINGERVSYDQLRLHFLSLRKAYSEAHPSISSSSAYTTTTTTSAFAPDGSILRFGPLIANSTNGGREGYLAAHTVLANLISNSKWDRSPLLSTVPLDSSSASSMKTPACSSSSSSSCDEPEEHDPESTPRKRRIRTCSSSLSSSRTQHRIKYNALAITDTMEIQWMEGKEGECRKITKFERSIRRPVISLTSSTKNVKQRRC